MADTDTQRSIGAIWRIESPKLIAALSRLVRDVGLAEDLAHDALVAALEQWPSSGTPPNPGAWLMLTAKHRAIDRLRKHKLVDRKHEELRRALQSQVVSTNQNEAQIDGDIGDDLLRLIFIACHPVLSRDARVALTLRLLGGLTTEEIAKAYLLPESTIAQRIVRAKRTLAEKQVPFETPRGEDLKRRLFSVLEVIYLIFNEGYTASSGPELQRADLSEEALRLGRVLAELAPDEPEVHGLVALMELQASRGRTRTDTAGQPVLLLNQDRSKWDYLLIQRGLKALKRAETLSPQPGSYTLQASIAACHARARRPEDTDWKRIASLYSELAALTSSPIVELNRAVAVGMAFGPTAGLVLVDRLTSEPALEGYSYLFATRAHFLKELGRTREARAEFEHAAGLAGNERQRQALLAEAAKCSGL